MQRWTTTAILAATIASLAACAAPQAGPNAGAAQAAAEPAPPAAPATIGQELGAVAANKVEVVFPAGGASLTAAADHQLDLAARLFRDANPVLMFTSGYSDRSGDEYSNLLLSAKRAQAVKRGLVARGIPEKRLLIRAMGESDPAVPADPLSPENRRVTITWRLL